MQTESLNLLEKSADNPDLLACLTAAYESYGARDPLAACVGGDTATDEDTAPDDGDER
jgi:hypothetical protein